MKKIFFLFIAFGSLTTAFAQSRKIDEAKRVINGEPKEERKVYSETGNRYPTSTSGTEDVNSINKEYDRKINAVKMNPFLSPTEKERRIRELENERNARIRALGGNRGGSYGYNNNKSYKTKGNNGKHLGWEKGVGNPHRTGGRFSGGNGNGHGKGKGKH